MDEPLGALDRKLREQMQVEIIRLHKKLGFTVIYVTHDQTEALTMSDRVAVFDGGVVQQCATPEVLYEDPANAFVAGFVGENNFVPGKIASFEDGYVSVMIPGDQQVVTKAADIVEVGADCVVSVRPEKIVLGSTDPRGSNVISAKFTIQHYVGDFIRYFFKLPDGSEVIVKALNDAAAPRFTDGEPAHLSWRSGDSHAFGKM